MRRSGWLLPLGALAVWAAAVGWPAGALVLEIFTTPPAAADVTAARPTGRLLLTSAGWAGAVALGAAVLGWAPGRLLGAAARRRGYAPLAALCAAPVCLPAYVVFYAWWQSWPADSALYRWAVQAEQVTALRAATLLAGWLCWSWPLVAWSVAAFAASDSRRREELLRLDGAGLPARLADRLRRDGRGLALGAAIVFLFVFNNTTSFDIAQIYTFGFELKAMDALGAAPGALLRAAAPALAVALAGAAVLWLLLGTGRPGLAVAAPRIGRAELAFTAAVWGVSTVVPAALFAGNLGPAADLRTFLDLYGRELINTVAVALAAGGLGAAVAVGLAAAWQDHRRWVRRAADVQGAGWLLAALVPGTVVALALEAAYNRPGLDAAVYGGPAILVLGYLARYGLVAALLGRWLAAAEPRALLAMRRLDGAGTLPGYVAAGWPRLLAAGGAALAIVTVLSMSELAVTARVQPAGFRVIAGAILNAVHYQRPDTVLLAVLLLAGLGLGAGFAAVGAWWPLRRLGS